MRQMRIRKILALFTAFCLMLPLFSGCTGKDNGTAADDGNSYVLRVLVDKKTDDTAHFHEQLSKWIVKYKYAHEDIDVVIEEVPYDPDEREIFEKRIKTEMLSGNGPDIFLLQNVRTSYWDRKRSWDVVPFFEDVNLAMRNGLFYDLSELYDNDSDLHTENLRKEIMDAGVVDGERYVLPMRYDIPIIYADKAYVESSESAADFLQGTIVDIFSAAVGSGESLGMDNFDSVNRTLGSFIVNMFPNMMDYDSGKVMLSPQTLSDFLSAHKDYLNTHSTDDDEESEEYEEVSHIMAKATFRDYSYEMPNSWLDGGMWMDASSLQLSIEHISIAQSKGIELEMYPIRAVDGSVVADVTFWGAISSGCREPELAYEFLRKFLSEEYQWDRDVMEPSGRSTGYLAAPGWPVRTENSVEKMAQGLFLRSATDLFYKHLDVYSIKNADIPITDINIDVVQFPPAEIGRRLFKDTWDLEADFDAVSEQWVHELKRHLDEG